MELKIDGWMDTKLAERQKQCDDKWWLFYVVLLVVLPDWFGTTVFLVNSEELDRYLQIISKFIDDTKPVVNMRREDDNI